jgi:hypothetical protein
MCEEIKKRRHNKASQLFPYHTLAPAMPSDPFEKLADELILDILEYLNKNRLGFDWPISRCNKRLRRIALPVSYRTVYITDARALKRFIGHLIKYPAYSSMVRTLDFVWCPYQRDERWPRTGHLKCTEEARNYSPTRPTLSRLKSTDPKVDFADLFHLLPRLESLEIMTGYIHDLGLLPYLAVLMNQSHLSTKLQIFKWNNLDLHLHTLTPVLLVPSLREFCCSRHYGPAVGPDWSPDLPNGTELTYWYGKSNVEKILLDEAKARGDDLVELLRLPRALKILTYYIDFSYLSQTGRASYGYLKRTLDPIARSLEFLELSCGWRSSRVDDSGSTLSLSNFRALRFLYLDIFFIYPPTSSAIKILRIAESLPPSLETLYTYRYHFHLSKDDFNCWKRVLTEKSSTCLPNLRYAGHLSHPETLLPLIDLARSKNVQVIMSSVEMLDIKEAFLSRIKASW